MTAAQGFIDSATLTGNYLNTQELRALQTNAEAHSEWTDVDLEAALTNVGARYGPLRRSQFIRDLQIRRFEGAFGKIRKSEVHFVWRLADASGGSVKRPEWVVQIETLDRRRRRLCYALFFEPINGRLIGLIARSCN